VKFKHHMKYMQVNRLYKCIFLNIIITILIFTFFYISSFAIGKLSSLECPDPITLFTDVVGAILGVATIFYSILVINDLRSGGHHLTGLLIIDLMNSVLLYIHVWWETRRLIFAVDYTRFMTAVSPNDLSTNTTMNPIDDVTNFIDLQYYLSWDRFAMMALGVNLILFSIRIFSFMEIHPVTKVFYQTFYITVGFLLILIF
jgi:hypothetical protein